MDGLKNKDGAMRRGGRARLAVQLLLTTLAAGGFMLLNVNAGPLVKMDFIGGWETRRVYIALCGALLLLAMTVLALQRRSWAEYAVMASALLAGALMRFYMIDLISPYYGEGLAPFLRAMEDGLNGLWESDYTPLTVLIFKAFLHTGVYPMYCVKLLSIGCDLLIALALAALWGEDPRAKVAAVLYLFCPVFFLYGAYAGTMDSAYVLLVVLCALALQREKTRAGLGALWRGVCAGSDEPGGAAGAAAVEGQAARQGTAVRPGVLRRAFPAGDFAGHARIGRDARAAAGWAQRAEHARALQLDLQFLRAGMGEGYAAVSRHALHGGRGRRRVGERAVYTR